MLPHKSPTLPTVTAPRGIRRHVRSWRKQTLHRHRFMCEEGQSIAELEAEIEELQRQALAPGAEPTADVPAWVLLGVKIDQCPHSAEGDMRALNEESGFDPGTDMKRMPPRTGGVRWNG
jgi:hypothetical protein